MIQCESHRNFVKGSGFTDICTVRVGITLDIEIHKVHEIIKSKHVINTSFPLKKYLPETDQAKKTFIGAL